MQFDFSMDESDDKLLHGFFTQTRMALGRLLREGLWGEMEIPFYHNNRQQLAEAWSEETEPVFDLVHQTIDSEFKSAAPRNTRLANVGLTGRSLRAKLQSIVDWSRLAAQGLGEALWATFKGINIVLGSFFAATQVGDAIEEMKQLIENSIWPFIFGPIS